MVWITCGLLWCSYQLFGLSFWRHPFTAEDPLVRKWFNAKFLKVCSDEETNSYISWMARGWVHFQQIFIFGWTFPLSVLIILGNTVSITYQLLKVDWVRMWYCDGEDGPPILLDHTYEAVLKAPLQYITSEVKKQPLEPIIISALVKPGTLFINILQGHPSIPTEQKPW